MFCSSFDVWYAHLSVSKGGVGGTQFTLNSISNIIKRMHGFFASLWLIYTSTKINIISLNVTDVYFHITYTGRHIIDVISVYEDMQRNETQAYKNDLSLVYV